MDSAGPGASIAAISRDDRPSNGARTVAVAFHEPVVGGAAVAVLQTLRGLEERGWRFVFWVPGPGDLWSHLERQGYDVTGEPRLLRYSRAALRVPPGARARLVSVPGYLRRFRRWLVERAPDVLHANTLITIPEAVVSSGTGVPVLLHVHEVLSTDVRARVGARFIRSAADAVVANSAASVSALAIGGVEAVMVHNGVELPEHKTRAAPDGRRLVIGTLGTVSRRKGSDLFLATAARLAHDLPGAEFRMIGPCPEGSERQWAEDMLASAQASGLVTGERSDVFGELHEWDMLVLPSRNEPFGLVVVEAMASGLPVVATRVGGVPEIVTNDTGILVAVDDTEALAQAVLRLAADPAARISMGRAGRERVKQRFTIEAQVEGMHRAYSMTLRSRGG